MRTAAVVRHVTVDRTAGIETRGGHREWCAVPRSRTRVVLRELQPFYMSHLRFWVSLKHRTRKGIVNGVLVFLLDNALRMSQEQQPRRQLEEFFLRWASSHRDLVEQLHQCLVRGEDSDEELMPRIQKVIQHYRDYYEAKKGALKEDAFQVLNPPWKTPLETAFMWMGGWRPSTAFQLALVGASREKLSEEFEQSEWEDKGGDLILTGITQEQEEKLKAEQASTREQEEQISCKAAHIQKTLADSAVVKLAQGVDVTGSGSCSLDPISAAGKLKEVMQDKVQALSHLLLDADCLRIRALEMMVGILNALQSSQYLVTAGVLQMAFKQVGELKEKRES